MRKDEMGHFFKAVASYLSLWDRKPDDEQMMLWWNSLKGCKLDDVRKAFDELVRSSQWPPKPVDVLRLAPGESDARGRSCSVAGCAAPVVVDFGRPLCWVHSGDGKPTSWLVQHRWQVLLAGQFLLREKGEEAKARAMYGDRAVDFVLNNPDHEDVRRFTEPPKPEAAPRRPAASEKTLAEAIPKEMQAAVQRRQEAARRMEARLHGEPDESAQADGPAAVEAIDDEDAAADRLCASLQEEQEGERRMREAGDARAEHEGAGAEHARAHAPVAHAGVEPAGPHASAADGAPAWTLADEHDAQAARRVLAQVSQRPRESPRALAGEIAANQGMFADERETDASSRSLLSPPPEEGAGGGVSQQQEHKPVIGAAANEAAHAFVTPPAANQPHTGAAA